MKKISDLFHKIVSPIFIGLILTAITVSTAFYYYTKEEEITKTSDHNFILKGLKQLDEKSIDIRLSRRGPRPGSEEVVLLAVDEKAVKTVGRWPWPRQVTAKAIGNAIKMGAKVVSFDVVFSEPSNNQAKKIYEDLKSKIELPAKVNQTFIQELNKYNSDQAFSDMIKEYADHLVLGTFFEDYISRFALSSNYVDLCHNFIYEQSNAFKIWDKEESIIAVSDPFETYVNETLSTLYKSHLDSIESAIRDSHPQPKNRTQAAELNYRILNEKYNYCESWLSPEEDELYPAVNESWAAIKAEDEFIEHDNFEDWINSIQSSLTNIMPQANLWVMNTPLISSHAKHTGFFNAQQDMDGTIRRSRLVVRTGNHYMPSIALKSYLVANNFNAEITLSENLQLLGTKKISRLKITDNNSGEEVFTVPVNGEGILKINYAGPQKMFKYMSLADLLTDSKEIYVEQRVYNKESQQYIPEKIKVNKNDFIKDKYFILGATAIGIFDLRVTPFDENYPGLETHVNVLDNLIRRDFLYAHPDEETKMLIFLLVLGILLSIALAKIGAVSGLLLSSGTFIVLSYIDKHFFFERGIVLSIIFPLGLTAFLYVFLTFYKYFTEERNKRELRSTFSKYVSPAIVDEVLQSPENLELGGRKEDLTVLFSDIRGFTTISEKLDPKALGDLLNSYLTPMTDLVFAHRGTLDKYMGDAVMAFFGAPIHYPEHPHCACRCALEMLVKLGELQEDYKKQGLPMIDIGIGLNTGECSVGNMGSQTVRSYTVMGDSVNLGSRLEGINKQYGTRIVISEFTYERVKDSFVCREIDLVRVKGKALPVRIYELVAENEVEEQIQKKLTHFMAGYKFYHEKNFTSAISEFNQALAIDPEDHCSTLYIKRCNDFIETPPPADWDGVFIMTTK